MTYGEPNTCKECDVVLIWGDFCNDCRDAKERRTMVDTTKQQRLTLTEAEMEEVISLAEAPEWAEAFIKVYDIFLSLEGKTYAEMEVVVPWEYAIPSTQWTTISKALLETHGLSVALAWMNSGPSGFDEEAAK